MSEQTYDVVIIGAGIAGALIANELGAAGKSVLILEAGPGIPASREEYMETFYTSSSKLPESPYPPAVDPATPGGPWPNPARQTVPRATTAGLFNADPGGRYVTDPASSYLLQAGPLAFASTYERVAGGTTWHWLGTSLRLMPGDLQTQTMYGVGRDWPIAYSELVPYYERAESAIGVAATKADQGYMINDFSPGYEYPMPGIKPTILDEVMAQSLDGQTYHETVDGQPVTLTSTVYPTPQGRNSVYAGDRRTCAGNTNCIPICPIQAKYDGTVTLNQALQTGAVTLQPKSVAMRINVDSGSGRIASVDYMTWEDSSGGATGMGTAKGAVYVLAAHAIETPKLLLMSRTNDLPNGVANSSDQVGRNLMDHVIYLAWAMMPQPVYPYRGPLSTSGIESMRDGSFRRYRSPYRIEIGNEGWNWAATDPTTTTRDWITGSNGSQTNPNGERLVGTALVQKLNSLFTRQMRVGFLCEQPADPSNRVTLSTTYMDGLGLPRPQITYGISDYTAKAFVSAQSIATQMFERMGATEYTQYVADSTTKFTYDGTPFNFAGAGHIIGTTLMGTAKTNSVLNSDCQSWDHENLYIAGSSVFPAEGTANPTLTIAALALRLADKLKTVL